MALKLIFLFAYVLADSSLGFFGLILIGIFTFVKRFPLAFSCGLLACAVVAGLFFASENFHSRAPTLFLPSPIRAWHIATGAPLRFCPTFMSLGTPWQITPYSVSASAAIAVSMTYIGDSPPRTKKILKATMIGLNKDDANSLFVRVVAELGPVGLIALFGFLIVCANVEGKPYRQIRNALLPYFLVRMSRFGAYFSMELYFFVGLYLLNYLDYRRTMRARRPPACRCCSLASLDALILQGFLLPPGIATGIGSGYASAAFRG